MTLNFGGPSAHAPCPLHTHTFPPYPHYILCSCSSHTLLLGSHFLCLVPSAPPSSPRWAPISAWVKVRVCVRRRCRRSNRGSRARIQGVIKPGGQAEERLHGLLINLVWLKVGVVEGGGKVLLLQLLGSGGVTGRKQNMTEWSWTVQDPGDVSVCEDPLVRMPYCTLQACVPEGKPWYGSLCSSYGLRDKMSYEPWIGTKILENSWTRVRR